VEAAQPGVKQNRDILWLRFCGFEPEQIDRLIALKQHRHDNAHMFERAELNRMTFAKWLIQEGRMRD